MRKNIRSSTSPKALAASFPMPTLAEAMDEVRLSVDRFCLLAGVEAYGETNWDALRQVIKDVLVDLRFRGDYTPFCRKFLQVHVANNDLEGFAKEIADQSC